MCEHKEFFLFADSVILLSRDLIITMVGKGRAEMEQQKNGIHDVERCEIAMT
jgi:hypothetical protein